MVSVVAMPAADRSVLESMARSRTLPHRKVVQSKALLRLAEGRSARSTAAQLGTYPNIVARWRDRYLDAGVDGVGEIAPGRGRKPEIDSAVVAVIRPPDLDLGL